MTKRIVTISFILVCSFYSCREEKGVQFGKQFPKSTPQELSYENVSILLTDMKLYAGAVKKLDQKLVQKIQDRYTDVYFQIRPQPLILGAAPDAAEGRVTVMVVPKDPQTGSSLLLKFDRKLPIVDSETLELQIRSREENAMVSCSVPVSDPAAYLNEFRSHDLAVRYTLYKKFVQSGTYDFDALTFPAYRTHGYPFVVFDLVKAEFTDKTANLDVLCRLQG